MARAKILRKLLVLCQVGVIKRESGVIFVKRKERYGDSEPECGSE
jgi:hypothetical protein